MQDKPAKYCIVNVALGGWYEKGQKRLKESLVYHGFAHDIILWKDWPNDFYSNGCSYNIKAAAFLSASLEGYTHILWCDASVWALKDPQRIFEIIDVEGYYAWSNGYNCAQECNDRSLEYFGVTRDEAENMSCVSSGIIGFNTNNPLGGEMLKKWLQSCEDGIFSGSRNHDNQSQDPRFLHHRQDQSCISLIMGKMGIKIPGAELCRYYEPVMPAETIFAIRGM